MTEIIAHRRNTLAEVLSTPTDFGIEVDIRIHNGALVCQHDPLRGGALFSEWLQLYNHGTLILNVKEEGLEALILEELSSLKITNYFFLDQSFPFLLRHALAGQSKSAIRVSEYESIETALNLRGLVDWVWIDTFSRFPLSAQDLASLKERGYKTCLVSPELHGNNDPGLVEQLQELFLDLEFAPDAVCTKKPEFWSTLV